MNRKCIFTGNYVTRGKIDWKFLIKVPGFRGGALTPKKRKICVDVLSFFKGFFQWELWTFLGRGLRKFRNLGRNRILKRAWSACRKKKNCMLHKWNKKKNFLHCCKKGKKCYQVISSFRELYKISAKLQAYFPCSLLRKAEEKLLELLFIIDESWSSLNFSLAFTPVVWRFQSTFKL